MDESVSGTSHVGSYGFGFLSGLLDTRMSRREVLIKMREQFQGTPAGAGISSASDLRAMHRDTRAEIKASNPYLIAAYNTVGVDCGTRTILPHELEHVISAGHWYRDVCCVDSGLFLDFSGHNHALALNLYEQLASEQKSLWALPAVVANLHIKRAVSSLGLPHGLQFVVHSGTTFHTNTSLSLLGISPLGQRSAFFDARDLGLERCGVPDTITFMPEYSLNKYALSTLREASLDRILTAAHQRDISLSNLGISRLHLGKNFNINIFSDDFTYSDDDWRVIPVDRIARVLPKRREVNVTDIELAPEGNAFSESYVWQIFGK